MTEGNGVSGNEWAETLSESFCGRKFSGIMSSKESVDKE
jgi:hypothetical protein